MEPAVRFVLEMGCGNRFRREFVLLIDPPDLPAVQTAGTQGTPVPPAARVVPTDEPRWGSSAIGGGTAPVQSASAPVYDAPLAEPPVKAAPAPRKAAPKPRPKPAARPQVAAQPQPASAPPPPVRAPEAPKAATTDRLVLADTDPAAASPPAPTPEQAARDARAEALTKQVEALTKEVARMREDMDKLSTRNRELVKEAESRTGWFAAAGLGIVIAGVVLGLMGRREKRVSWRDNLAQAGDDGEAPIAPQGPVRPEAREDVPAPKPVVTPVQSYYRDTGVDPVTDLDVTKLDVRESTGMHGTIMNTTAAAGTTMFPSDIVAGDRARAVFQAEPAAVTRLLARRLRHAIDQGSRGFSRVQARQARLQRGVRSGARIALRRDREGPPGVEEGLSRWPGGLARRSSGFRRFYTPQGRRSCRPRTAVRTAPKTL